MLNRSKHRRNSHVPCLSKSNPSPPDTKKRFFPKSTSSFCFLAFTERLPKKPKSKKKQLFNRSIASSHQVHRTYHYYLPKKELELPEYRLRQSIQYNILSKGDFITCKNCRDGLEHEDLQCTACRKLLPRQVFLQRPQQSHHICVLCPNGCKNATNTFLCMGTCGQSLHANRFDTKKLFASLFHGTIPELTCKECDGESFTDFVGKSFTCGGCKKDTPFHGFEWPEKNKIKKNQIVQTLCYTCYHPPCGTCRTPSKERICDAKKRASFVCDTCSGKQPELFECSECGDAKQIADFPKTVHCNIKTMKGKQLREDKHTRTFAANTRCMDCRERQEKTA